jgi:cation diffusion facilitator family transporter
MGYDGRDGEERASRFRSITRVLVLVLVLNVLVALAKLGYGALIGSVSMVADGFHSLFDGLSNVVGLVGVAVARRPADESHPYGHGKYETWASAVVGGLLVIAAWEVGSEAVSRLIEGGPGPEVGPAAFAVMVGTLAVNVSVSLYERRKGRLLRSDILLADSEHTMSDAFVSLGVIAGLVLVRLGFPQADSIAALVVVVMILRAAWRILSQATDTLSDRSRIPPAAVAEACVSVEGLLGCHDVRTRGSMSEVYVDLHVQVDPGMSLVAAHEVAERVERAVFDAFPQVADVIAHVEPMDEYQASKTEDQLGGALG